MLDVLLAVVGVLAVVLAVGSARVRELPLSTPLVGLLAGVVLGLTGVLDAPGPLESPETWHEGTRILLALSVMGVALRYPVSRLRGHVKAVALLLLVVMPVMALVSTGVAALVLPVSLGTALLIGTAVSPTDPVLASSMVTGEPAERDIPERNRILLSVESGANDGLALPLVLVAVGVVTRESLGETVAVSAWQVLGGAVVGAALGAAAGKVLTAGRARRVVEEGPDLVFTMVLALGVLGVSGLARVDGVLAVFCAGLAYNALVDGPDRSSDGTVDEGVNRFAVLPLFVLLGATLPWSAWRGLGWGAVGLVVLVLALRRLPAVLALARPLRLRRPDAALVGWFGPVGVSALFYATFERTEGARDPAAIAAVVLVVAASTAVFGTTSPPLRRLYAGAVRSRQGSPTLER